MCAWSCSRERKREREKVVRYSTENSHLSSEGCCIKEEADKQAGYDTRGLDLNPHGRAGLGYSRRIHSNVHMYPTLAFELVIPFIFFFSPSSVPFLHLFSSPIVILHPALFTYLLLTVLPSCCLFFFFHFVFHLVLPPLSPLSSALSIRLPPLLFKED